MYTRTVQYTHRKKKVSLQRKTPTKLFWQLHPDLKSLEVVYPSSYAKIMLSNNNSNETVLIKMNQTNLIPSEAIISYVRAARAGEGHLHNNEMGRERVRGLAEK